MNSTLTRCVAAVSNRLPSSGESQVQQTETPSSNLYECPDCKSVFLDKDSHTCRSCGTVAERVPDSLFDQN